ncbi:hypothetical protein F01_530034 [Burkholderia cenocepacia]|nr:hypothetical protein F01_530034 [Burkholderia cenocepacia]
MDASVERSVERNRYKARVVPCRSPSKRRSGRADCGRRRERAGADAHAFRPPGSDPQSNAIGGLPGRRALCYCKDFNGM